MSVTSLILWVLASAIAAACFVAFRYFDHHDGDYVPLSHLRDIQRACLSQRRPPPPQGSGGPGVAIPVARTSSDNLDLVFDDLRVVLDNWEPGRQIGQPFPQPARRPLRQIEWEDHHD